DRFVGSRCIGPIYPSLASRTPGGINEVLEDPAASPRRRDTSTRDRGNRGRSGLTGRGRPDRGGAGPPSPAGSRSVLRGPAGPAARVPDLWWVSMRAMLRLRHKAVPDTEIPPPCDRPTTW